ncbi:D-tyrosyl-tRNA(Tyr) deacylase [Caldicellulosiruptor saccharolyticus DSM 8903]|uniref:D-aminoacyl-tRNA deacylase n=1 Tax=Caldicellulosiruptor saccharolyticus (strain ATCC 43494 / DSM 8903 / Tp8T 6331) TaxID=351627 RepID=DTD_CALS8|nr:MULTISPECIES: D-aminoacyl-tRNA deacylase [Caldicellulosiruptor]A4XI81.1 RecName: Full=D-aminoacyl-tRNA deacylase; Short=DTD; AltName: Full=Gly-tRNA(Ala) deacylase [Caldicellulosiruptor saccharolyticus DSM 8903]ABP66616.1 D-tyrosyl-tRNA(Tyr) deacylase [Caldicellulosiruptor saccharolyticus DSM 8903]
MRAVVQRVKRASVAVDGNAVGEIDKGLCILLGVANDDTEEDANYLCEKIVNLRIFEDETSKFNLSLKDIDGEVLVVSNFTVMGDARKGRRPNFMFAADKEKAERLYNYFVERLKGLAKKVECGIFQAHMEVEIVNDGPVTILLDSKKVF